MPVADVFNIKGEKVSQVELPDQLFDLPVKPSVLHEVVTMQQAAKRSGTASVKNRSEIRGSTRKLFRQKGTGRARRGDIKSGLLRGGGVIFGPKPKSYAYKIPKRKRRTALKMVMSSKFKDNDLVVLNEFPMDRIRTQDVVGVLETLRLDSALIVTPGQDRNLECSSRNIKDVKVLRCEGLNVYDVLKYKTLVLLEESIRAIEGRLAS